MGKQMDWKQFLAYITSSMDQELLVRNAYLVTENRILRQQITGRVRLSDGRAEDACRAWEKAGKENVGGSHDDRHPWHDPRLVPQVHCEEV